MDATNQVSGTTVDGATQGENTQGDVVFHHVDPNATTKRTRASGVNEQTFIKTYMTMAKEQKTNKEIATALGMNESSLVSRASALRAQWAKLTPPIALPYPKTERGSGAKSIKMTEDALRKFLQSLDGSSNVGV